MTDNRAAFSTAFLQHVPREDIPAAFQHGQRLLELRAEGLDDVATQAALDDFTAWEKTTTLPTDRAWLVWRVNNAHDLMAAMGDSTQRLATAARTAHAGLLELARLLCMNPCGRAVCSCHPKPFPAARDYRRRTRHRNRRRK